MKSGVKRIYSDPALRCPRTYLKLVRRLMHSVLVRFQIKRPKCRVGMFAVNKKNNEQRLVLDARYSSCYFTDPPKVHLASGGAFASIEVEPGQQVWLGNVDIQVAFYAMELPAELLTYFGLPHDVCARDVGISEIDGVKVHPDQMLSVVFCAIPMGWTHSLAVCQNVLEGLAQQVPGVDSKNYSVDRKVAPPISPMIHTEYADNFESYAYDETLVTAAATGVE